MVLAQRLRGFADLALAGQEDENVAGARPRAFVDAVDQRFVEVDLTVVTPLR